MGAINFDDVYANAYVRESVEVTTEQLARKFPALASCQDDIRQELWIYIAKAVDQYDPERGGSLETFFRNVIEKRSFNVRRHLIATIGSPAFQSSIDTEVNFPACSRNEIRLLELRMDLAVVMERLTPIQRQICQWIMDGVAMKAIARRLNIPYSSLFHFYIEDIRNEFQREKMEKYLENL